MKQLLLFAFLCEGLYPTVQCDYKIRQSFLTPAILCIFLFGSIISPAQHAYHISRISTSPVIDGIANDSIWQQIPVAEGFTTTLPQFGKTPQFATAVKMAYDNRGIYITANCQSGKVRHEGSLRDDTGTGDYFSVGFDTWNDDQNAFVFAVTAGGQIIDQRNSSTQIESGYVAPWKARTRRHADGWTVEMWIPFTALRFPTKGTQDWGLQFTRFDRHSGETSTWNPQDPAIKDIVWQYGQLQGLTTPAPKVRLGLSILRQTKAFTNYTSTSVLAPAFNDYYDVDLGLDGRIGFNSVSTLDFTVLPVINLIDNGLFYDPSNTWLKAILYNEVKATLHEHRLFSTEESGIAAKTPTFWKSPILEGKELVANIKLPPDHFYFSGYDPRILQNMRFTTRTRSNWGIAVSNAIFNRPEFDHYVITGDIFTELGVEKHPNRPVYNHIAVEKSFRNNSWIQASSGNFIVGKGLNTNNSAVGGQWRDAKNQLEARGNFVLYTQFVKVGSPYSRAEGQAHIGKVNGLYLWSVDYQSPRNGTFGFLNYPSGFRPSYDFAHQLNASGTKQNFKPTLSFFKNTRQTISAALALGGSNYPGDRQQVAWTFTGLDQSFRSLSATVSINPKTSYETLHFTTIQLRGKRSLPFSLSLTGSTDTRKKNILHYGAGLYWRPLNWQISPAISCSPAWVLGKKWIINLSNTFYLPAKGNRIPFVTTEKYLFERSANWGSDNQLAINFNPNRKLSYAFQLYISTDILYHRKAFEILPNGQKSPADEPLSNTSANNSVGGNFEVNWYLSPIKHFRFRFMAYQAYNEHLTNFPVLNTPASYILYRKTVLLEWSWVWNMSNKS